MATETVFVPSSVLEQRIHAGDFDGVIAALRGMSRPERKTHIAALREIDKRVTPARWSADEALLRWWGAQPTREQCSALGAALFFCGSGQDRTKVFAWDDRMYAFLDMLEPEVLKNLAEEMSGVGAWRASLAQRLVVEGLADRPDSDVYIMGLINAPRWTGSSKSTVLDMIALDPGLLDGPLMRLFEVEGSGDVNMASVEKYAYGKNTWSQALLELTRTGKLSRAVLIEKSLETLERDWPQFRAGWFSRFHDVLAPTADEMAPLTARYLGLCHSRIPPTVTLALASLAALLKAGRLDHDDLLDALAPVMSSAVKGQVDAALKLLDAVVKQEPGLGHAASALAQRALAHESPDLHKKVIARFSAWGFDAATRAEIEAVLPHVSATNQPALSALLGVAPQAKPQPAPASAPTRAGLPAPLDAARKLVPIVELDELVQTIAFVFENDEQVDEFERALDALVRLAPQLANARSELSPVIKRAAKLSADTRPVGAALALLLAFVIDANIFEASRNIHTSDHDLRRRIADLTAFAALGTGLSALSCATHRRGFIDPLVLADRIEAHSLAGISAQLDEQVRAILRLPSDPGTAALERFRTMAQTPLVQACRYALGDDVEVGAERALFLAACRIRHPGQDDPRVLATYGDVGPDGALAARYKWTVSEHRYEKTVSYHLGMERPQAQDGLDASLIAVHRNNVEDWRGYFGETEGSLLYAASVVPASLERFFAEGAFQIGYNTDWWEARWYDKAFLSLLMDPTVPATPHAVKMVALALGAKEPGQTALAIDVFVALLLEQRADVQAIASEIRWFVLGLMGKNARYAKSLASAARAHPAMPAAVVAALCIMLDSGAAAVPKDTGPLLELLLELLLVHGLALPAGARERIARLPLTGKAKAAQKDLLARLSIG